MKRLILGLWLAAAALPTAAQDERGSALFRPCVACHGATAAGNAEIQAPGIAGLPEWYVAQQLRNFRNGRRGADAATDEYGAQMARMAEQLWDDGEVKSVAAYVAALPPTESPATVRGKAKRGEEAFVACAACHGADAAGNETLGAPPLRGLDDWYVVKQLAAFRNGVRGTHPDDTTGASMRAAVAALGEDFVADDVAAYVATLRAAAARSQRRQ
jgi:cytochrome c oxidase subunit 2